MPPTDRQLVRGPERQGTGKKPPYSDQPATSSSVHWLDDFLIREGIVGDSSPILRDRPRLGRSHDETRDAAYEPTREDDEDAVKSRRISLVVGLAAFIAVLGLGGLAYVRLSNASGAARALIAEIASDLPMQRKEPVATPLPSPKPLRSAAPVGGLAEQPKRSTEGARTVSKTLSAAAGLLRDTQHAVGKPPEAPSRGPGALVVTATTSSVAKTYLVAAPTVPSRSSHPTPAPPPAMALHRPAQPLTLQPAAVAGSGPMAEQSNAHPAPPPPAHPPQDDLPVGTHLHLQIVYAPWGPQAARDIAGLQARLRAQLTDVATSDVSEWPVRHELVIYFFPDDRAAASLVAANLAQITKRTAPTMLVRRTSATRPGTVDILLPLRSGEDLKNDNP